MNESIWLIFIILVATHTLIAMPRKPVKSLSRRLVMLALCLALTSNTLTLQDVAVADVPTDDAFPITTAPNDQITPAVAYNASANEFLLAWVDRCNPGNGRDIYARRLASDGTPLGTELAIATATADQRDPAITARAGFPDYLVAWIDLRNLDETTDIDIYGQIVGAGGSMPGGNIPISTRPGRQRAPSIAHCPTSDTYLAVWDEDEYAGWPWRFYIFGQQVSSGGSPIGETATVTADYPHPAFQQIDADLVYNPQCNGYLVVYRDAREYWQGSGYNDDIYSQRLSCTGEPLQEDDLPISAQYSESPGGNRQNALAVAYDSQHDQYLVVWQDERNDPDANTPGDHRDIYGQLLSADGAPVSTPVDVNIPITMADGNQVRPDVAYSSQAAAYLVVWADHRGDDADIYARLVTHVGTPWGEEVIISNAPGDQLAPAVAYNETNGYFLIIWQDHCNQASNGADIYGRLYLPPEIRRLYLPLIFCNDSPATWSPDTETRAQAWRMQQTNHCISSFPRQRISRQEAERRNVPIFSYHR